MGAFVRFILWVLFQVLRYFTEIVVKVAYYSGKFVCNRSQRLRKGACIHKIIYRYNIPYLFPAREDFLAIPIKYDDPRIILQDNVSMYSLTEKEAHFVVVPPDINIYSSDVASFIGNGQFKWATHVITMPLDVLHKVAREVGKPRVPLVMIHHTARAGSTILVQAFETIPGIRCIVEPLMLIPEKKLTRYFSESMYEQLVVDIIYLLCKPVEDVTMYCIKTTSVGLPQAPIISRNFPGTKQLFISRDGYKSADSHHRGFQDNYEMKLSMAFKSNSLLRRLFPTIAYFIQKASILNSDIFPWANDDFYIQLGWIQIVALNWSLVLAYYKHLQDAGIHFPCVLYEDIVGDTKLTMKKIFNFCGVSDEYIPQALAAFSRDSQRDCSFSRAVSSKKQALSLDLLKKVADEFNIQLGVPLFGETLRLSNVL